MKKEMEQINDKNILSDDVSESRRDFLKSVGKYSVAVAGAMMLAGTQLSIREAEAAEPVSGTGKSFSGSPEMKRQRRSRALKRGTFKASQRLDPKMKGSLSGKTKMPSGFDDKLKRKSLPRMPSADCW